MSETFSIPEAIEVTCLSTAGCRDGRRTSDVIVRPGATARVTVEFSKAS